jgi:Tfp pilus assembly protein PilX
MTLYNPSFSNRQQSGAVLIVSLVILLLITLVTFSSSKGVILQQKMTATARDSMTTLEAAEQALLVAEATVETNAYVLTGTNGLWDGTNCDSSNADCYVNQLTNIFNNSNWSKSTTVTDCGSSTISCQYHIVDLGEMENFGLTRSSGIQIITDQYIEKIPGALSTPRRFRVIVKAESDSGIIKILQTYYASST